MGICQQEPPKKFELNFDDLNLKCPLCENKYSSTTLIPKNLPCGHTMCQDCIQKIINKNTALNSSTMICPFDKIEYEFQNFPTSYTILKTIENLIEKNENISYDIDKYSPKNIVKLELNRLESDEKMINNERILNHKLSNKSIKKHLDKEINNLSVIEQSSRYNISDWSMHSYSVDENDNKN